jgi:hypothetical protein
VDLGDNTLDDMVMSVVAINSLQSIDFARGRN